MKLWPLPLLACVLAASCGGDSDSAPSPGNNSNSAIPIRGGERIVWDQPVDSPTVAKSYTYTMYVDGAPMPMLDVRCADVRSAGGVECSGRLPPLPRGAHTLELTAAANGVESSRSSPIAVSVNSLSVLRFPGTSAAAMPGDAAATLCVDGASQECFEARLLAVVPGEITSPVASGEQLFFVEDGTRVRVVEAGLLSEAPALMTGDRARIIGLAIPPDFERSSDVFVAWSELSGEGESLNVSRYRELGGTLGQGAVIVSGLPLSNGGLAPIAVDDRNLVYVALPASKSPTATPSIAELSGFILRFQRDGSITEVNPNLSPVIAQGYTEPSTLVWDRVGRQMWVAGTSTRWRNPLSMLARDIDSRRWPAAPAPVPIPSRDASSVAVTVGPPPERMRRVWLVSSDGVLRGDLVPGSGSVRFDALDLSAIGDVSAVVGDGANLILITKDGPVSPSMVWHFTPQSSPSGN